MASLKEIKTRIGSVKSTRQITSAMKMVASAKLHKAQGAIESMLPYQSKLNAILTNFLSTDSEIESPFTRVRPVQKVALVVFSSNSSLCGSFNANVLKQFALAHESYQQLGADNILVFPVGKKIEEKVRKMGYQTQGSFQHMADKPSYDETVQLATRLMEIFWRARSTRWSLFITTLNRSVVSSWFRKLICPLTFLQPNLLLRRKLQAGRLITLWSLRLKSSLPICCHASSR